MELTIKYPEKEGVICIVCKQCFTDEEWKNSHTVHKPDCPFQNDEEPQCDCADVAHERHCPQCLLDELGRQRVRHASDYAQPSWPVDWSTEKAAKLICTVAGNFKLISSIQLFKPTHTCWLYTRLDRTNKLNLL